MGAAASAYQDERADAPAPGNAPRGGRGALGHLLRLTSWVFGAASLTVLLAVIVTIPILSFYTLGYMLRAAARVAKTGKLSAAFPGIAQASRLGQIVLGVWLSTLPARLFFSLEEDAALISPGSRTERAMGNLGELFAGLAVIVVVLALTQGGRLSSFLRPFKTLRQFVAMVQRPETGPQKLLALRQFVGAFSIKHAFSLGLRAYLAAAAVLVLPTLLLAVTRGRPIALVAGVLLAVAVAHVPVLAVHLAVHDELRKGFDVKNVRYLFRRAPLSIALAVVLTVVLALPLYLLKVELVPRDALWLPSVVFVVTMFPPKIVLALAYHRAFRRTAPAHFVVRWAGRVVLAVACVAYSVVVYLSPALGWHGVAGMFEHHAFLVPVPF